MVIATGRTRKTVLSSSTWVTVQSRHGLMGVVEVVSEFVTMAALSNNLHMICTKTLSHFGRIYQSCVHPKQTRVFMIGGAHDLLLNAMT